MATTYATEIANIDAIPSSAASGAVQGGRMRRFRATVPYAGQADGDDVVLARVPAGYVFAYGVLTATATAGATATLAIGVAGATGKYRTAATFTAANTPTLFGNAAAVAEAAPAGVTEVRLTIAAAALPSSANALTVDLYFSAP
jgi:hypothetical protein